MSGVPVVCDHCGYRGLVGGLIGGSGSELGLNSVRVSCPRCGQLARGVDGEYDLDDGVFTMTAGAPEAWQEFVSIMSDERWTRERVDRVQRALRSPGHGGKPEHVAGQVARIDPALGAWVMRMLRDPAAPSVLAVLNLILTGLVAAGLFDGDDEPQPTQIIQVIERCQEDLQNTPGAPSKRPSTEPTPPTPTAQDPPKQP